MHDGPGQKILFTQLDGDQWTVDLAIEYNIPSALRIPSFSEYICRDTNRFPTCTRPCVSGTACPHRINRHVVSKVSAVFTSSYFGAEAIKQFYNRKALVIYPPVNPEQHLVKETGEHITLVNGDPLKGLDTFLQVAKGYKEFRYMIVGHVPSLDKSWLGYDMKLLSERNDMREVWAETKVLLVPSIVAESFGRVCVEASLNGIPVVASDRGGLPESAGASVVLSVTGGVEPWKEEVHRLMTDPVYYRTRSTHAREYASKFSVAESTDRVERLAEGLLANRGAKIDLCIESGDFVSKSSSAAPRTVFFGPWIGEFGWEVATWQAWCRKQARNYDKAYVCSFPDMEALYTDFAEFVPHGHLTRTDMWIPGVHVDYSKVDFSVPSGVDTIVQPIREFSVDGDFIKFGDKPNEQFECLIHVCNHSDPRKHYKNYPIESWQRVVADLPRETACIGTGSDLYIEGTTDLRGIPLDQLMNYMAGCKVVVGGSAGPMHLACFCGATIVVWAPGHKTFVGGPLETRYKTLWNPFGTKVYYIVADDWCPDPNVVLTNVLSALKE